MRYTILHVEEVVSDAESVAFELERQGVIFNHILVNSKNTFINALENSSPDVILCSDSVASMDWLEAIKIVRDMKCSIPFILLPATIYYSIAKDCLNEGIEDFLFKDGLYRLPLAIKNAVEKYRLKKDRQLFLERLVEKEKRHQILIENSVDAAIILNAEGKTISVSANTKRILGYTDDEMLQFDLFSLAHPDDVLAMREVLRKILANPGMVIKGHTGRMLHKDGSWRWFEATAINLLHDPVINGIVDNFRDVTEKKLAEQVLKESERKFRQIVETAQEGIWMTNEFNKTVFVNRKMSEMLEYSEQEIIGKTNYYFKDEQGTRESLQRLDKREHRVNETHESKFFTKSGRTIWTIVSTNPVFNEKGEYKGGLAMVTDITSRKEQELEIKKISEERKLLIAELTKSVNDLKQFTFITSHNLKSPLSNLIGLLTLVDYSTLDAANKEVVEMFSGATFQLNKTVNDLNQALIIKDNVNLEANNNNLKQLINSILSSFAFEIKETNCKIEFDLDVETIVFNTSYLQSILINLLSNAFKYRSVDRPLCIKITTQRKSAKEVLMLIKDNGIGIDLTRHREKVFGLYQRFHSNSNSSGLGLFIVKSQIDALGGRIDVESEVNKGTTFIITFKEKEFK